MSNIVGFSDYAGTVHGDLHCWLCQKQVSSRALFCHHCGTIQPVRAIDHFARLGLERRIDIDPEQLEHQYAALGRTLDPQRFMIRGIGERGHAAKQLEALNRAYEVLREPLRRGRYWISLHEKESKEAAAAHPFVVELRQELDMASAPSQCDRVAQKAGQALEVGIMSLMQALRGENWQQANATLVELEGLESILVSVRARRGKLMPADKGKGGIGSVK
ncbi:MAG TPA: molecular chaperone DnaJ [Alphaproteobacteria bacterium]|nr:molecular chaperone DnaJ [Alphaproteobacteria bacterium]